MTTDDELRALAERVARLSRRELVRVLDMALDVEDRWRDEERAHWHAAARAAEAKLLELERQHKEAASAAVPPEAKREAG
jgi:hypothetical protein